MVPFLGVQAKSVTTQYRPDLVCLAMLFARNKMPDLAPLRSSKIMISHRPLGLPIILAIVMIALLVVLTVGWVILNVSGALHASEHSGLYWALLTIGSLFIVLLLVGTVLYLILSIKAINLTRRQSNFIDSVTHELKSPMASMKLYLQTLSRHQVSMAEQSEFLSLHARRP